MLYEIISRVLFTTQQTHNMNQTTTAVFLAATSLLLFSCSNQVINRQSINLGGAWHTSIGTVHLPGTTDESLLGDTISNYAESGRLQRKHSFVGELIYSADIEIPTAMLDKHLTLFMERTKPSTLWIDGDSIGSLSHLQTPHIYDITGLKPGLHHIDIRIDNSNKSILPEIGGSHAITEATQTNWNGIVGKFCIEATPLTYIECIQTYPHIDHNEVDVRIVTHSPHAEKVQIELAANGATLHTLSVDHTLRAGADTIELTLPMKDCKYWSAENHNTYTLSVCLKSSYGIDMLSTIFGMRTFATRGTQFTINGQPTYLRGKHDACVFPLTGYAPTTTEEWLRTFRTAQEYGINHYRFHSWCPPEAAFEAADICGIYLQPELPYWGCLERDKEQLNNFLLNEGYHILNEFGNHPSFVMFALGNELCGDVTLMREWTNSFRQHDPRHLYAFGSNNNLGWLGQQDGEEYLVTCRIGGEEPGKYNTHVRASFSFADAADGGIINGTYPNTRQTYANATKKCSVPVVSHETCQFQIFPDFAETDKYTGVLKASNLEVFSHRFDSIFGTTDNAKLLAQAFHQASGQLSKECYKADIEMCLRTPNFGGFQMLDLQDYPGQGSALVGMLDAFMESKNIVTPEEFRGFCSAIVPLALMDKYTWTTDETFSADIEIANYSETDFDGEYKWKLTEPKFGYTFATGNINTHAPQGTLTNIGKISLPLNNIRGPQMLTLSISGANITNKYHIWVYDDNDTTWQNLPYVTQISPSTYNTISNGATMLYIPSHADIEAVSVGGLFTPDYWSYSMFKSISESIGKPISPGTLGYCIEPKLCDFAKQLIDYFPTNNHSDWQWWSVAKNSRPLILDNTQLIVNPIVWSIDNVDRGHKMSILFEIPIGKGHLLVSTTNIDAITNTPEGRQYVRMLQKYIEYFQKQPSISNKATFEKVMDLFNTHIAERNIVGVKNLSDYKRIEK